jgi:hypothetical protein
MDTELDLLRAATHLPRQRRVIASLLDTAGRSLWRGWNGRTTFRPPALPGPELVERVMAPAAPLVRDYLRHVGGGTESHGDPSLVPAHLFPQWTFPLAARGLRGVPYPLTRILNAGCRLEANGRVRVSTPLTIRAQLMDVVDDGRRALLHQRVVTGTPEHSGAVVADLYAVAPTRPRGEASERASRTVSGTSGAGGAADGQHATVVPPDARELARIRFGKRAGLAFALLTGDLNPVHWVGAYARAAGFATPILHGFALMARVHEALARALFAGASDPIRVIDVRFKRPFVLGRGREVGLYQDSADARTFWLTDAPGVRPYLVGQFEPREEGQAGEQGEQGEQGETHA